MSALQQFRFKGQAAPRAKPLPPTKWEEHKAELCDLYQKMTLDDLMVMMKVRHNFTPSRRQCISQFEKWDVHKYNASSKALTRHATPAQHASGARASQPAEADENNPLLVDDIMDGIRLAGDPFQDPVIPIGPPKRPKSLQSLQSLQQLRGVDERPKVPPKKRQKLLEYISSRDNHNPYADLGLAFDAQEWSSLSSQNETATHPDRISLGVVDNEPNMDIHTPQVRAADSHHPNSDNTSDLDMTMSATSSMKSLELNDNKDKGKGKGEPVPGLSRAPLADETVNLEQLQLAGQTSQQERRFDCNRPIDMFSKAEIHDMKLAADFLYTVGFDGDAFALYALLLKRYNQSSYPSSRMTISAMIKCARSAYWSSQVEIAQTPLKQKFELRDESTDVEHFLFRMILADTYARLGDQEFANLIVEHVMGCEFANERLLLQMPNEDRSLDLLTYQYLTHGLSYKDNLVRDAIARDCIPYDYPVFEKSRLALCFLQQTPGPFELQGDIMKNPCIRSCLQWCVAMLESTDIMTEPWENVQPNDQDSPLAEHFRLFCCLWECWQGRRASRGSSEALTWASQAEKLMGISAAELLGTLCWMIVRASPKAEDLDSDIIILQAHAGAASLIMRSDEELGCHFLDEFTFFDICTRMSPEQKEFRTIAREYARKFIEKSLEITLLEAQGSYAEPNELTELSDPRMSMSASRQDLRILAARFHTPLPTLAPSLYHPSVELSSREQSFRAMQLRLQQGFTRPRHNAAILPSSLFTRNSNSNLISMSELSQAMVSSLSLESLRTAGTSAMERASNVSSRVRERVAEFEGGPLSNVHHAMQRTINM